MPVSVPAPLEVPPEAVPVLGVPVPVLGVRGVPPLGLLLPVPVGVLPVRGVLPVGLLLPVPVGAIEVWGHRAEGGVRPSGAAGLPVGRLSPACASFVSVPE